MNTAAVYKGFNISINRAQLQKTARLEQWNFDVKTLSEALLFRNTHNTQTAGWREGVSTHTPSCLEPFSTKIAVERWSLNCWLIPWVCLSWTPRRRRRLHLVLGAELMPSRKHLLSPPSHSFPSWGTSYKNKGFDCSVLVPSQDALADRADCARGLVMGSQLGSPYIHSAPGWQEFHGISLLRWHHCPHLASLPSQSSLQLCQRWCLLWWMWIVPLQVLTREAGPGRDLSLHVPDKGLHQLKQGLLPLWTQLGGRLSLGRGKDPAGRWRGTSPAEVPGQAGEQRTLQAKSATSQLLPPQPLSCPSPTGMWHHEQPKLFSPAGEWAAQTRHSEQGQDSTRLSPAPSWAPASCAACPGGARLGPAGTARPGRWAGRNSSPL